MLPEVASELYCFLPRKGKSIANEKITIRNRFFGGTEVLRNVAICEENHDVSKIGMKRMEQNKI